MKIVYHRDYCKVYSSDPASSPGRIESIYEALKESFEFVEPEPVEEELLKLVHSEQHISDVKALGLTYHVGMLAVGGAVKAGETSIKGEPVFALIRPPGHHASRSSSWGFCFFNNIAVSIEHLRRLGRVKRLVILDIDLHYGDGTASIFDGIPDVVYYHLPFDDSLNALSRYLESVKTCDLIAVSAGFDRHEEDWGGMLKTEDYTAIGRIVGSFAEKVCGGRVFAVLEGGYNHKVLGGNVKALLEGMT